MIRSLFPQWSVPNCSNQTLKLQLQFSIPRASSSPGVNQHSSLAFSEAPQICSRWGSAPLLVASLTSIFRASGCRDVPPGCWGAHPSSWPSWAQAGHSGLGGPLLQVAAQHPSFGLPPGRKPPSEWIFFLLGLLATPWLGLWCRVFSKYIYSLLRNVKMFQQMSWICRLSHQAQIFASNAERDDLC